MAKTTRVKFEITFDVDVEAWNLDYGTETIREVQRDVKEYLRYLIFETAEGGHEYLQER